MNKKNIRIMVLLIFAVILFCIIQFYIIPNKREKDAEYTTSQTDALTHDITVIEDYRSPYLGNASNTAGLFGVLPLNNISKKFEINSEECILTVHYLDTVRNIGREKVQRDLIYNTVAAMAAIDNLSGINYHFDDESFFFDRTKIEEVFGTSLSSLTGSEKWKEKVQGNLLSKDFCEQFYQKKE